VQEQHDEAAEYRNGDPIVDGFHRRPPSMLTMLYLSGSPTHAIASARRAKQGDLCTLASRVPSARENASRPDAAAILV
jgi:hypothetical protein